MNLTAAERTEILTLLNVALYDANEMIRKSQDTEEIAAYKDHRALLRKWIHRLSQGEKEGKGDSGEDEPTSGPRRVDWNRVFEE